MIVMTTKIKKIIPEAVIKNKIKKKIVFESKRSNWIANAKKQKFKREEKKRKLINDLNENSDKMKKIKLL